MKGLSNRVAVITGGAGGIGAALCRRMNEEGVKVAILDLNRDVAASLAGELGR
ncbi:SDR family NAD(P)-dependent oxidoreductase, partial [Salmonella enterica]